MVAVPPWHSTTTRITVKFFPTWLIPRGFRTYWRLNRVERHGGRVVWNVIWTRSMVWNRSRSRTPVRIVLPLLGILVARRVELFEI